MLVVGCFSQSLVPVSVLEIKDAIWNLSEQEPPVEQNRQVTKLFRKGRQQTSGGTRMGF